MEKLRDKPVSKEELDRAKRNVLASVLSSNQTAQSVASRMARDTIGMHDPDYLDKYAQRIQSVTAEQLQQAAQRFLQNDQLITVKLLPLDGHQPEPMTRPAAAADAKAMKQEPVHIDNATKLDDMREYLAQSQDHSHPVEVDEPVQFKLDNGLRVIVQRSTVVPAVSMQMYWKGGLLGDKPGEEGAANAMASMLKRGTENYTADELSKAVEDLGASLGAGAGNNTTFVSASSLSEDWPKMMELMGEITLRPTFPKEEWQRIQPRLLAAIDRQTDSWYGELSTTFRDVYFDGHPWSQSPLGRKQVVAALTPKALREFHDSHLGAHNAVLAVVGDVDPQQVRQEAQRVFGEMPGERQQAFHAEKFSPAPSSAHQKQTRKPVAAVTIALGPTVDRANKDYATLRVLSRVFSNFPSGWLEQELRGRSGGLVYAAWAGNVTGLIPGYFQITFNTSPDNAAEALRRTMQLIERAKTGEISDEMLQRAKAKVLSTEFLGRQSNGDRAMQAALDELYGADDLQGEQFRQRVKAMTADEVQAAAARYLNDPVVLVLTQQPIAKDVLESAFHGKAPATTQPAGQ